MPELPEVEAIRTQLEKFLPGHKILGVEVKNQKVWSGDIKSVVGAKVKGIKRFAKVISIDLANGFSILAHVKLTGQFIYRGPNLKNPPVLSKKVAGGVPGPHTHVLLKLDKGGFLYYNDIRRFGWLRVVKTSDVKSTGFVGKLGPEPFAGLTLEKFQTILSKSKKAVKVLLMDQEKLGGVGNIYATDALWLACINPKRPAMDLTRREVKDLFDAILKVLREGIKRGGASELAFVTPDGGEGEYQNHFLAYGQQGKICPRCKKDKIVKIALSGRGTYFCPNCQKYED